MTAQLNESNSNDQATSEDEHIVKTALDCDILTVVRDAHAHEEAARQRTRASQDPMDELYKPLGNKDVASVLNAANHRAW